MPVIYVFLGVVRDCSRGVEAKIKFYLLKFCVDGEAIF
jgi:hypothetical protein